MGKELAFADSSSSDGLFVDAKFMTRTWNPREYYNGYVINPNDDATLKPWYFSVSLIYSGGTGAGYISYNLNTDELSGTKSCSIQNGFNDNNWVYAQITYNIQSNQVSINIPGIGSSAPNVGAIQMFFLYYRP